MRKAELDRAARRKTWIAQIVVAVVLGLAVPAKFTGAPAAVATFQQLGVEPYGRVAAGVFETITVVLVLVPATAAVGGLLALGLMTGAILSHVTVLGLAPGGDASLVFMAVVAFIASSVVVAIRRREIPILGRIAEPPGSVDAVS